MELTLVIIMGVLFALIGLACIVAIIFGLPGSWIIIALAVVINLVDGLYLAEGRGETFDWRLVAGAVLLAAIGELLEFLAGALGAKTAGSSRRGAIGALVGGLLGAILGAPFGLILGALLGAVVGTFIGAIVGEISGREPMTMRQSIKPATGATIGRVLGTLSKVPIALVIWLVLTIDALWR
ncbi:MAG: DUF456 domain-containing protein [Planctomycetota bacterium]|nr:DUF456 domain-containing protein [Planctomycetota bacterium]